MDLLVAIDTLDDAAHNAKQVPMTDQIRLPPDELRRLVDDVRAALLIDQPRNTEAADQIARLDALVAGAKKVFLTSDVRFDKEELFDALDTLRLAVAQG